MKGVKAKGSERSEGPSLNYEKTTQPLPSSHISELWESAQNLVASSSVAWLAETAPSGQGGTLARQEACRANGSGATGLLSRQCPAETCHSAQTETVARQTAFVAPVLTARQVDFVVPFSTARQAWESG